MRVLILTQFFEPEPVLMNLDFARALAEDGNEVRVLTGFPNYPGGKVYPGYRIRWWQREEHDGITIIRVPLYASHSTSKLGRIANYVSYGASAAIFGTFMRWRPDAVFVYHPPLTVGIAAAIIKFFRRVPFAYNIQDLWPDTLRATGMINSERVLKLVGTVAKRVYRHATMLVPQSPGFMQRLREAGVPDAKQQLIYNWCDEAALSRAPEWVGPPELDGKFTVTFAGTMGGAQGLHNVLDAAEKLRSSHPHIRFLFIGGGIEKPALEEAARLRSLNNTLFLPAVPMEQVGGVLRASDALLVHLRPDPLFEITIPSKTQAYFYAARPILMAVKGDAAALVERAQAGRVVEPGNADALASAVVALADMPAADRDAIGARGRAFYEQEMSFAVSTAKIRALLASIARR